MSQDEVTTQLRESACEYQPLPIEVVPDWSQQVRRATELGRFVDRHLDHEAGLRHIRDRSDFRPRELCPEQRVQMVTDLSAVTGRGETV